MIQKFLATKPIAASPTNRVTGSVIKAISTPKKPMKPALNALMLCMMTRNPGLDN